MTVQDVSFTSDSHNRQRKCVNSITVCCVILGRYNAPQSYIYNATSVNLCHLQSLIEVLC